MELVETLLPGVGIRYELQTRSGRSVGIVVRREGAVELALYDVADRDRATDVLQLDPDEVDTLADILGAPRITQRFADLSREVPRPALGPPRGRARLAVRRADAR